MNLSFTTLSAFKLELPPPPPPAKGAKGPVADGPTPLPRTHLTIEYSNVFSAVVGEVTSPAPAELTGPLPPGEKIVVDCSYEYKGPIRFRMDESLAALSQLINTKVMLRLHASDVANAPVIASAAIDMLPFAKGQQEFSLNLTLLPIETSRSDVPKLIEGSMANITVTLNARRKPEADSSDSVEGGSQEDRALGNLEPFNFLTPADISDGANVIEIEIGGLHPLPPSLQAASDLVCGKDGQGGKVTFMAGIAIPSPAPSICIQGRISNGQVVFDGPMRFLLSADGAEIFRSHLEAGNLLIVEIARYVQCYDSLIDNAWASYHASAPIDNSSLLIQDGCTVLLCESADFRAWQSDGQSCLPPSNVPSLDGKQAGKVKPIEPDADTFGPSAWIHSKTLLSNLKISLVYPLVPLWQPPPAPTKSIVDLIPSRDLYPASPPLNSSEGFRAQINAALSMLAQAYASGASNDYDASNLPIAQRHKALIFELNKSGAYLSLLDSLKPSVERIIEEDMKAAISVDSMNPLFSPLYAKLMNLIHLEISSSGSAAHPQPKSFEPAEESSLSYALDYEEYGRWLMVDPNSVEKGQELIKRAQDIHRKRLKDVNNARVWLDIASFFLRSGDLANAAPALRSALEIDPQNKECLIAYALASLEGLLSSPENETSSKTQLKEAALAAGHSLVKLSQDEGEEALSWSLLALTYASDQLQDPSFNGGGRKNIHWFSCRQKLSTIERNALSQKQPPEIANGFFQVWTQARLLRLPLIASKIKNLVSILQQSSKALKDNKAAIASLETSSLVIGGSPEVQEISAAGMTSEAQKVLRRLSPSAAADHAAVLQIQADAFRRIGRLDESILALQKARLFAVQASQPRTVLSITLRLAATFISLASLPTEQAQDPLDHAFNTLMASAAEFEVVRKSPLSWILIGLASTGDSNLASKAFQEANKLDPELPGPWAHLALIEARAQRWKEASYALLRSSQLGLLDTESLVFIVAEYESAGRWREAAEVLQKIVSILGDASTMIHTRLMAAQLQVLNAKAVLDHVESTKGAEGVTMFEAQEALALALPVDEVSS